MGKDKENKGKEKNTQEKQNKKKPQSTGKTANKSEAKKSEQKKTNVKQTEAKKAETNKTDSAEKGKKQVNKKREKARKILMYIGFVICAVLLVTSIVTTIVVAKLDVVPIKYIVLVDIVMAIFITWMTIMQRWFTPGIVAKVIAVIMIAVMIIGSSYMNYTYKSIKKMTGVTEKIDKMCVYVMDEDEAQTLSDTRDYEFGILKTIDRNNTNHFKDSVEKQLSAKLSCTEYDSVLDLVGALYSGEVQALLMNSAYANFASGAEEYEKFDKETRIVYSEEIVSEVKVEKPKNDNYLSDDKDNVFTIYISGIDTRGSSPRVNSNSDVNILMTVNKKTRQVLLISTPRDYYVPLSISNGVKDKLTHAGGHGIDVSVDTLEMLYEINIDDYLKINFTGFIDVIDALGGVKVYSKYDFYSSRTGDYFQKGYNQCDGARALDFARERHHVPGGDKTRGKNQMEVIDALINKMASSQLLNNYTQILDSLTDSMVTSMSYDKISDLVKFQLNDMRGWEVVKYSVDGENSSGPTYSAGSQILYVMEPIQETVDQAKEYLRQIYAGEKVVIKTDDNADE